MTNLPKTAPFPRVSLRVTTTFFLCLFFAASRAQTAAPGYSIQVTLKPFAGGKIYLGYHYGKLKAVADSLTLNAQASGTFEGREKLPPGIYFLVSPSKVILFEILIDHDQHFSVTADTLHMPESVVFTHSPENTDFLKYTLYMGEKGKAVNDMQIRLGSKPVPKDSATLKASIKKDNEEIRQYRDNLIRKDSAALLGTILLALKDPEVPPAPKDASGRTDSTFAYRYYKAHYWEHISLTDERLLRTPIFEPKLDRYFKDLVNPDPDSINREIDHMLLYSRSNPEMFKYLLVHFTQAYVNPEYMGQDAVFVHIFEKYINTGQAEFFTEKYRKYVNDRAYSLMANLIGQQGPDLEMTDTSGKPLNLYSVKTRFTVICFWDPTCSHCKETVPKLDSIYQAKWENEDVTIYAVMVDGGRDNWLKFISDHNLKGWKHVYQTTAQHDAQEKAGHADYRQLYDVYQTPELYLLDKDKRIIAKKLSYLQLEEVINHKLTQTDGR